MVDDSPPLVMWRGVVSPSASGSWKAPSTSGNRARARHATSQATAARCRWGRAQGQYGDESVKLVAFRVHTIRETLTMISIATLAALPSAPERRLTPSSRRSTVSSASHRDDEPSVFRSGGGSVRRAPRVVGCPRVGDTRSSTSRCRCCREGCRATVLFLFRTN